ncbi:MAG: hypothetical protein ACKN8W_05980 [Actinomycetales bacterium]|jgi:hypothetical protein
MSKFLTNSQALELLSEKGRELPAPPAFFGILAFGVLMFLLYLVMRLDKD